MVPNSRKTPVRGRLNLKRWWRLQGIAEIVGEAVLVRQRSSAAKEDLAQGLQHFSASSRLEAQGAMVTSALAQPAASPATRLVEAAWATGPREKKRPTGPWRISPTRSKLPFGQNSFPKGE